jgi:hypothetical protein
MLGFTPAQTRARGFILWTPLRDETHPGALFQPFFLLPVVPKRHTKLSPQTISG